MKPDLIVILCTESSGSTLLSMMLAGSPSLLVPPEPHILRWQTVAEWKNNYPVALNSLREAVSRLDPQASSIELSDPGGNTSTLSLYEKLINASKASGKILVDKTPAYSMDRSILDRAETFHPFYIWLLRHPLAVAASTIDRTLKLKKPPTAFELATKPNKLLRQIFFRSYKKQYYKTELEKWLTYWYDTNTNIQKFLEGIDKQRQSHIHFEQLVQTPEHELRRITSQIGIEFSGDMLHPWKNAPSTLHWGLGSSKIHEFSNIEPARSDAWRRFYSEKDLPPEIKRMYNELLG